MSNIETTRAPIALRLANYFQSDNYLKGYFGKDLVKSMLERSGYTVCHYGYEDTLLDVMSKRTSKTSNSNTGRRIRKSPDLLVYDDQNIMLAEIKTRLKLPPMINPSEIEILKEFWNDAILVVIVPDENIFYAQKIAELETPKGYYLSLSDFKKLQDIFKRVSDEHISHYKGITLPILQTFMSRTQKDSFNRTRAS
jgi:Holliday junction resolvase